MWGGPAGPRVPAGPGGPKVKLQRVVDRAELGVVGQVEEFRAEGDHAALAPHREVLGQRHVPVVDPDRHFEDAAVAGVAKAVHGLVRLAAGYRKLEGRSVDVVVEVRIAHLGVADDHEPRAFGRPRPVGRRVTRAGAGEGNPGNAVQAVALPCRDARNRPVVRDPAQRPDIEPLAETGDLVNVVRPDHMRCAVKGRPVVPLREEAVARIIRETAVHHGLRPGIRQTVG